MRELTLTVPDDFYETLINFLKRVPNVTIKENIENEIPIWQQEMVLDRIKNAKPEDYISWEDFKNKMDKNGYK